MSEDVSATMRVGITVILVAALVATVLNLMVMSNSLLSGGQTTLQSGIDSVSQQEFASYNNTKVSGTQVNTALSLFQGRDVAILIQTKTFKENVCPGASQGQGYFMNYGAILSANTTSSIQPAGWRASSQAGATGGTWTKTELSKAGSNLPAVFALQTTESNASTPITASISGSTVGNYYVACVGNPKGSGTQDTNDKNMGQATQKPGAPNFEGLLWDSNGVVNTNSNIIGCSTLGNPQYLLSSARFQSILIKDSTGSIIGIAFYQI